MWTTFGTLAVGLVVLPRGSQLRQQQRPRLRLVLERREAVRFRFANHRVVLKRTLIHLEKIGRVGRACSSERRGDAGGQESRTYRHVVISHLRPVSGAVVFRTLLSVRPLAGILQKFS